MAFTCGFFNSVSGDRRYNSQQLSSIFDGIITDGVFAHYGSHFEITPVDGMNINVGSGRFWFNHVWGLNDGNTVVTLDPADISSSRVDAIVAEIDHRDEVRNAFIKVVKGAPGSGNPTLSQENNVYQYPLAYVTVPASATSISASNIQVVVGTSECPFATSVLESVNVDNLFDQWDAQFQEWFQGVQNELEGDIVTNLINQINQLKASKADLSYVEEGVSGVYKPKIGDVIISKTKPSNDYISCNGASVYLSGNPELAPLLTRPLCYSVLSLGMSNVNLQPTVLSNTKDSVYFFEKMQGYTNAYQLRGYNAMGGNPSLAASVYGNSSGYATTYGPNSIYICNVSALPNSNSVVIQLYQTGSSGYITKMGNDFTYSVPFNGNSYGITFSKFGNELYVLITIASAIYLYRIDGTSITDSSKSVSIALLATSYTANHKGTPLVNYDGHTYIPQVGYSSNDSSAKYFRLIEINLSTGTIINETTTMLPTPTSSSFNMNNYGSYYYVNNEYLYLISVYEENNIKYYHIYGIYLLDFSVVSQYRFDAGTSSSSYYCVHDGYLYYTQQTANNYHSYDICIYRIYLRFGNRIVLTYIPYHSHGSSVITSMVHVPLLFGSQFIFTTTNVLLNKVELLSYDIITGNWDSAAIDPRVTGGQPSTILGSDNYLVSVINYSSSHYFNFIPMALSEKLLPVIPNGFIKKQ